MDNNGLSLFAILFLVFLGLSAALIIWMFVSLVHLGDERRQQIVGKACTLSFSGLVGYFLLRTLVFMLGDGKELLHPLIARRKSLGLSQEELAKACGVSRQTINAIENNKYDPTLALAFHLAKTLGTTVDELFTPQA